MSYFIWLILGVAAFVIEMMMPTFFALFAGIGFLSAALVAFFLPESLFLQLIVAALFMVIGAVVFKRNRIADKAVTTVGTHNEFVGMEGVVTAALTMHNEGEVELSEPIVGSRRWPALCVEGEIAAGSEIKIVQLRGNTLLVEKK